MFTADTQPGGTGASSPETQSLRPVPTTPPALDGAEAIPLAHDPREAENSAAQVPAVRNEGYWAYVRRQYRKNKPAMAALWFIILLVTVALLADVLANNKPIVCSYGGTIRVPVIQQYLVGMGIDSWSPEITTALAKSEDGWRSLKYDWSVFPPIHYSASETDIMSSLQGPFDGSHLLGTDQTGRDVLAGLIHGSRISLTIGIVAMGIAALIGVLLGALSGYFGGWIDIVISRVVEVFLNFPTLFLVLVIIAFYGADIFLVMVVIGITGWMGIARLVRGEVLRVRMMEYVTAADSLGFSNSRIILRHVLPNSIGPVLVSIAFGIAGAILTESTLSFLGFGVPKETVTWGSLLDQARRDPLSWWLGVFPGIMVFLTVVSYNLIGDGLRDATDPRLRE